MVGRRILGTKEVERTLHRMALEIIERHYGEALPVLVPASERGRPIAAHVQSLLQKEGIEIQLRESYPSQPEPILLVDDVLYTGKTLLSRLHDLMALYFPPQVEILVLVDRGHKRYPICADYVGLRLATTLQEYVRVKTLPEGWEVWLE